MQYMDNYIKILCLYLATMLPLLAYRLYHYAFQLYSLKNCEYQYAGTILQPKRNECLLS